jgi:HK97 gp10 family phage protein
MATSFKVHGLEQLLANFRAFPQELQDKALAGSIRKAIEPMRTTAISLAPKRSGKLKAAIRVAKDRKPEFEGMAARYVLFVKYRGADAAEYWRHVEFGTSRMPPQPFLRPAFESNVGNAIRIFYTELAARAQRVIAGMKK